MTYQEAINLRISTRTYSEVLPSNEILKQLENIINTPIDTPFGSKQAFCLVNLSNFETKNFKRFGTYGKIKNAKFFIVGTTMSSKESLIDYGYALEQIVLEMTKLGLSSCWLGGNFNKSMFEDSMSIESLGLIPSIIAFGYNLETNQSKRQRKDLSEILTVDDQKQTDALNTNYHSAFMNYRLSPSALNGQPWHLFHDTKTKTFDFYMKPSKLFIALSHTIRKGVMMNYIDVGIAMNHFALTFKEDNTSGHWYVKKSSKEHKGLEYIMTWEVSDYEQKDNN